MSLSPSMKRRDLVLAIVAMCADREEFGRTSLQKTAFFVSECLGADLGHRAHLYGPFSDKVESDLEDLAVVGLIEETVSTLGFVNRAGHDARRYEYRLTNDGEQRMVALEAAYPDDIVTLRHFVARLTEAAGGLDQRILSPAAKTYFIAKCEKRSLTTSEIRALGRSLGWDLRTSQIKRVASVLSTLGLARVE